ncbi:MAG: endo-1,4-beta-xylanase [Planctomycetota bacterium]
MGSTALKRCLLLAFLLTAGTASASAWERHASEFAQKSCGAKQGGFWNLWSNGDVSQWLRFPESGGYTVTIEAFGQAARGVWPQMQVGVDLSPLQILSVDSSRPRWFTVKGRVEKGVRRFSVAFLNDYYSPDRSEDRNLFLGKVTIRADAKDAPSPVLADPPDWRAEAEARIARHRMGDLALRVVDGSGAPVGGASVHVKMVRHAFPFGCAVSSGFVGERWREEDRGRYRRWFAELFNHAVHENGLKWGVVNRRGRVPDWRAADAILAWCLERDIAVRGHCIVWANERHVPAFARKLDVDGLREAVLKRIEAVLARYRGKIGEYDLNNEMVHLDYFARRLGPAFRVAMFRKAHEVAPEVSMYVNDYNILSGGDLERYVRHIRALIEAGAPVGGIGCQGHFGGSMPDPLSVKMALDRLGGVCFSHPAVEGILLWGFWAGAHWRPRGALFDRDWRAKPAAGAYMRLLFDEWRTVEEGRTDAEGRRSFRAFYGRYKVTLEREGALPMEKRVEFPKGASGREITVTVAAR